MQVGVERVRARRLQHLAPPVSSARESWSAGSVRVYTLQVCKNVFSHLSHGLGAIRTNLARLQFPALVGSVIWVGDIEVVEQQDFLFVIDVIVGAEKKNEKKKNQMSNKYNSKNTFHVQKKILEKKILLVIRVIDDAGYIYIYIYM